MLHTVEHSKWTKVTLWTVTTSLIYPLAIKYVLKNMCSFSFCYEKPYCTYTVLLFLAHADHCLHSPPNSSNSSNISSSKSNSSNIGTRSPLTEPDAVFPRHEGTAGCIRRVVINRNQWYRWLGEWCVQHHRAFSVCSLDVSLYGVMSWGFYEFDELSFDEAAFKYFFEGLFLWPLPGRE